MKKIEAGCQALVIRTSIPELMGTEVTVVSLAEGGFVRDTRLRVSPMNMAVRHWQIHSALTVRLAREFFGNRHGPMIAPEDALMRIDGHDIMDDFHEITPEKRYVYVAE